MIFVTVGAQMPFDRLVRTVDEWAGAHPSAEVFAQISGSELRPRNIRWQSFLGPAEFREKVRLASVVVAHAGMGSILTALELGKPIVVMPRRGDLKETRNDHQFATARHLLARGRVIVAFDEDHLIEKLNNLESLCGSAPISPEASPRLIATIRRFVLNGTADAALAHGEISVASARSAAPQASEPLAPALAPFTATESEPV